MSELDIQNMKDSVAADLVALLAEQRGISFPEAMDKVIHSQTYAHLQDTATGLYFQSPKYVFSYLANEQ